MKQPTKVRRFAVQLLYQMAGLREKTAIFGPDLERVFSEFWENAGEVVKEDTKEQVEHAVRHVLADGATIDDLIEKHSKNWRIDRMSPVDLAILRLGVFELRSAPEVPTGLCIDEAVVLAQRFSTEASAAFVNGILDAVALELDLSPKGNVMRELVIFDYMSEHPLDQLDTTCLVLPFFQDERPVKGLSGYADWRLNGKISRDLQASRVLGNLEEVVLIPTAHRLKAQNVLLFGMGPREQFSKVSFFQGLLRLTHLLLKSKPNHFVFALHTQQSAAEQTTWLAEFISQPDHTIPVWRVLMPEAQSDGCLSALKKQFPGIHVRVEHLAGEAPAKRSHTLR